MELILKYIAATILGFVAVWVIRRLSFMIKRHGEIPVSSHFYDDNPAGSYVVSGGLCALSLWIGLGFDFNIFPVLFGAGIIVGIIVNARKDYLDGQLHFKD